MSRFFYFICLFTNVSMAAKILVYNPIYAQSHVNFMSAVSRTLMEAGHQVTVLAPFPQPNIRFDFSNYTRTIIVPMPEKIVSDYKKALEGFDCWNYDSYNFRKSNAVLFEEIDRWFDEQIFAGIGASMTAWCRELLNRTDIIEELRRENFDVGITEHVDACGTGLFHLIGLHKTILATSSYYLDSHFTEFGIPAATSYVPSLAAEMSAEQLANSMWARIKNAYLSITMTYVFGNMVWAAQEALDDVFPGFPRISDLAARSSLILTNCIPLLDFPRPTLHKVIDIGGITMSQESATNLTEKWREILSRRERNVLISFGSVAQSVNMPEGAKAAIVEVARRIPEVTFIWKYEKPDDDIGRGVENLVKVASTPQKELLQSGRIDVFLTHGGMGSTNEGVNSGTPLLLVGLFTDQMRNAATVEAHGSAIALDKWRLQDIEYLEKNLREILYKSSYAENARRLAAQLKARPFAARELLVRHTAFVAEHGPLHQMTPVSTKMNFMQRHFLDVVAATVVVLTGLGCLVFRLSLILSSRLPPLLFGNNKKKFE